MGTLNESRGAGAVARRGVGSGNGNMAATDASPDVTAVQGGLNQQRSTPSTTAPTTIGHLDQNRGNAEATQATGGTARLNPASERVDVDRIIELIAQRIDRGPSTDPNGPPPRYPSGL